MYIKLLISHYSIPIQLLKMIKVLKSVLIMNATISIICLESLVGLWFVAFGWKRKWAYPVQIRRFVQENNKSGDLYVMVVV